uniref:Uncharacterized protein n=1 Tax=Panagrolaimus sp. ES5 TaxID=591445 RepID=A0AC34GB35_9BILA
MDAIQPAFLHGLRDRVDFVRYHCLIRTTELLRSQYMKMSPLVLARLLPLLIDTEAAIRDALTGETLAVIEDQFPNVYIDNFVTCMFLFNKVGFGAYKDIERYEMPENPICFLNHDFSGSLKRKDRMQLYKFMLKKFDDQKRFMLINQISKTIFGNVVEGKIPFETPEAKQLILDGFQIIECPEARLTLEEGQQDAEEDADAEVAPENVQSLARATIRATFCSAFVHYIMPQLMAMARFLAQKKSPLQKEFRNCLAVIAEAYPDQLHVLFRDSVQFKTEIEAELRRRKKDARKSRMAKNRDLVDNIERAAEAQAQRDAENVDKENMPPPSIEEHQTVKIEPNTTQLVKPEPMEVEHQEVIDRTIDVSMESIGNEVEETLVAPQEVDHDSIQENPEEPI